MRVVICRKSTIIRVCVLAVLVAFAAVYAGAVLGRDQAVFHESGQGTAVCSVKTDAKQIALTFDTTFGGDQTEAILEILNEKGVQATFAVMGVWARENPELLEKITDGGHDIISHSMGHGRYDEMSAADVVADATAAKTYLETQLCVDTAYIRPPYGACGEQTSAALRQAGFVPVRWSVDSMDWKGEDAGAVTSRVISAASPGGIVVFQNNQENTVAALPDIIDKLKDLGYGFSSVSQMVLRENYALSDAGQQSPQQAAEGE